MSAYGPAKACDRKWFSEVMFDSHASQKLCQMVIGDFNWGNPYDHLIPESWNMATPKATAHSGTVPTRALCTHPVQQVQATPLPGIPSHLAVLYKVRSPLASERPETHRMRPRRCASFSWNATSGISNAQLDHIISEVNHVCPHLDASHSLVDPWRQWHSRVEKAFEVSVQDGHAEKTSKAERPKGSLPTFRPSDSFPAHRPPQSLLHRRLLRLHRSFAELSRQGFHNDMHVPGGLIRRMNGALLAANQQPCSNTCSMQAAFAILDNLIRKEEENTASQKRQAWKRNFKTFSQKHLEACQNDS